MARTFAKDVDARIETLNERLGVRTGEVGSYHRTAAYEGHQLQRLTEGGGVRSITSGYGPLAWVDMFVLGMIEGVRVAREEN